mmetsp:Transcript_23158/g.35123  ORF Transcript_23158/g.35123 Transcript_23158/m.35123 type:complete len:619 (-) Transcript_23158:43-1899(-)
MKLLQILLVLFGTLTRSVSSFQLQAISKRSSFALLSIAKDANSEIKSNFLQQIDQPSECDNLNTPPSLSILLQSISSLANGSDIRGKFLDHPRVGSMASVAHVIKGEGGGGDLLTPLATYCMGQAFGSLVKQIVYENQTERKDSTITICIGTDPRNHGPILADAFCRGCMEESNVKVLYTGLASTPAMAHACRSSGGFDGSVMVTASHLPKEKNGLKFYVRGQGGFTKEQVQQLLGLTTKKINEWQNLGIVPTTSGGGAVCSYERVDILTGYAESLKDALCKECRGEGSVLSGLKIVLNTGHGSGGFFASVLQDLGAQVTAMHQEPNGDFPQGWVPNPENPAMVESTLKACEDVQADIGVMFDTDADRAGFVLPDGTGNYQPLNRNRLIALLSVIFAESNPGCTIVTDSVTSEGLAWFLEKTLALHHYRYIKGYANVINKAKELGPKAEMAIETSGHCAMKENDYLDDGTYTAVKVIGLLARNNKHSSLLNLIEDLSEMPIEHELRFQVKDESLKTTKSVFDQLCQQVLKHIKDNKINDWVVDEENMEGLRIRIGGKSGAFLMLRQSLHDPVLSLQVESESSEQAEECILQPLLEIVTSGPFQDQLDCTALQEAIKQQ